MTSSLARPQSISVSKTTYKVQSKLVLYIPVVLHIRIDMWVDNYIVRTVVKTILYLTNFNKLMFIITLAMNK